MLLLSALCVYMHSLARRRLQDLGAASQVYNTGHLNALEMEPDHLNE